MDESVDYLEQLDARLAVLPEDNYPMSVSELDGYVTGLLCSPKPVSTDEWLPQVWGDSGSAEFPDAEAEAAAREAVIGHYALVKKNLEETLWVEPIYEIDADTDQIIWEAWVDGFTRALRLQAELWQGVLETAEDETRDALLFMMALQDITEGESEMTDDEMAQIDEEAADMIPSCIASILTKTRPDLAADA